MRVQWRVMSCAYYDACRQLGSYCSLGVGAVVSSGPASIVVLLCYFHVHAGVLESCKVGASRLHF